MNTYLAYVRVSTVKQGEGSSLQEQRDAIEAYARRHDLEITAWYEEMETAAKQGRRMFNRMLEELRRRRVTGLIIHKIDRGARNLRDWARISDLMDEGFDVRSAHESLDFGTRGGRLAADIQAVVAADYVRNLRDEVRKGIYGRLKQGYFPFYAPLGYLNAGAAKPKTIDPIAGPLIVEMFERYATGEYTLATLRQFMAGRGLVSRGGRPYARSYLATLLQNPFYIGLMRLRSTGETFRGQHSPLISAALFEQANRILSGRAAPHHQIHRFRFRRLVRCACGRVLTGERQKGLVYYRCHAPTCRGVSIRETKVAAAVDALLRTVAMTDEELGDLGDLVAAHDAELIARERTAKADAARRLALSEERLVRLTDALLDGLLDKPAFEQRRADLLKEQQRLREQAERQAISPTASVLREFERARMAQLSAETLSDEHLREMLSMVGSNLVLSGNELGFSVRSPFDGVVAWRAAQECGPQSSSVRTLPIDVLMRTASSEVPDVPQVLAYDLRDPQLGWRSRPEHGRFPPARVQGSQRSASRRQPSSAKLLHHTSSSGVQPARRAA